ncbi:helix-turn-helix domain-containing protein [Lacrimispora sp. JR3]|uniref:helix-turn-helix domain-containing protein n=1 Tax=Lacrimispora sinapis TaxID=3111456 RepID=UPI003749067A
MLEQKKGKLVERLKQFREENKLKQKEMYEAMQCSQAAYSSYENVKSDKVPSIEMLLNLHEQYDISIDWLLGIDDTETIKKKKELKTIGDIIESLFLIEDATQTSISAMEETRYDLSYDGAKPYDVTLYGLCFESNFYYGEYLNDFMKEWNETKEFCRGKEIGTTMYELWKKDIIQKNKNKNIDPFDDLPDEGLPFITEQDTL